LFLVLLPGTSTAIPITEPKKKLSAALFSAQPLRELQMRGNQTFHLNLAKTWNNSKYDIAPLL
jgi:hypothetical protein